MIKPWIYSLLFSHNPEPWIRHLDKPPCILCEHYLPDPNESFSSASGKCKMFGGKDLHTGQILYDYANSVRRDESKCTVAGNYFVGEKWILKKKIAYTLQKNIPLIVSAFCVGIYSFVFLGWNES